MEKAEILRLLSPNWVSQEPMRLVGPLLLLNELNVELLCNIVPR